MEELTKEARKLLVIQMIQNFLSRFNIVVDEGMESTSPNSCASLMRMTISDLKSNTNFSKMPQKQVTLSATSQKQAVLRMNNLNKFTQSKQVEVSHKMRKTFQTLKTV